MTRPKSDTISARFDSKGALKISMPPGPDGSYAFTKTGFQGLTHLISEAHRAALAEATRVDLSPLEGMLADVRANLPSGGLTANDLKAIAAIIDKARRKPEQTVYTIEDEQGTTTVRSVVEAL